MDYIHRLKVKERYPGIPTDLAKTFSHPIEGEVQDIDRLPEQEIIKVEQKHDMIPKRQVNIRPERRPSYYVLIQTLTQMW